MQNNEEKDQPIQVYLDDLKYYDQETSPYESEIIDLVQQIIKSGLKPESNIGWKIAEKSFFEEYNPNKDGLDEEITTTFLYYLNPKGEFVVNKKVKSEFFQNGSLPWGDTKESTDVCPLTDVMKEMDFEGRNSDCGSTWTKQGTSIKYISYGRNTGQPLNVIRKSSRKGQELYKKLKGIVETASRFIEECNRINSAYNAEFEPLKEKITAEYVEKRNIIQAEKNVAIDNARNNETKRTDLLSQIRRLTDDLNSLGFFAMRRKKELQAEIQELERRLRTIPTVQDVNNEYERKLEEVNQEEKSTLTKLERELRKKYPLPEQ